MLIKLKQTDSFSSSRERQFPLILERLLNLYPNARCGLIYRNPFELLIASILSPQMSDDQINEITAPLFKRFPTVQAMANAHRDELVPLIRNVYAPRHKARYILLTSHILLMMYDGKVPSDFQALSKLPGVARKGANLIHSELLGQSHGIAVDAYVKRVAARLGVVDGKSAESVERKLKLIVSSEHWDRLPFLFHQHAHHFCHTQEPDCGNCPLRSLCTHGMTWYDQEDDSENKIVQH